MANAAFSMTRMVAATLRHRPAVTLAVAVGVATATAVITGALLVGDSMRGSLRALTVQRLGRIDSILAPGQFFPVAGLLPDNAAATAVILFPGGTVEAEIGDTKTTATDENLPKMRRIGGVQIVAADPSFWELNVAPYRPATMPNDNGVLLNQSAADDLGVAIGDEVTLRLPVEAAVPADSPLGRRELRSEGLPRMRVLDIVPDEGLGRFSLSPSQASPKTVFASRQTIAEVLDRDGQANLLLLPQRIAADAIAINLKSLGWKLDRVQRGDGVIDVLSLSSDALLLPEKAVEKITAALPGGGVIPVMTYLANVIEPPNSEDGVEVPYSILTAIDSSDSLPLNYSLPETIRRTGDELDDDLVPMVVNDWTADRLQAAVGDVVTVAYYEPEVQRGNEIEQFFRAVITDVVPITKPSQPYRRNRAAVFDDPITPYNDTSLTPDVPGVTDQDSIRDWDLPFPLERTIGRQDDVYWNEHRLTPKAYIPLAQGRRLFGSRFGQTTTLRMDPAIVGDVERVRKQIMAAIDPIRDDLGWTPRNIRAQQLAASKGTTPFDALFLSLSMFVIVSAVMLVALLLRLGILQRLGEFGTLLAVGWSPRRVQQLALAETAAIGGLGVILGVIGGAIYAAAVLEGLRSWWVGAVTVPFLQFHARWQSIVIGAAIGWVVCMITAWWTLRFLRTVDPASLLGGRRILKPAAGSGSTRPAGSTSSSRKRWSVLTWASLGLAAIAALIAGLGSTLSGQSAAGAFVGGGMLLLFAVLVFVFERLKRRTSSQSSIGALAIAGARRNPLRSTLTIGLMATASFLILSITVFRVAPSREGTGGFDLIATSAQPLHEDLADPVIQKEFLGRDAGLFDGTTVAAWRMRAGDDASCNNLYQATQPTVLGIAPTSDLSGFQLAAADGDPADIMTALQQPGDGSAQSPIPVLIDQNTAMWSLQMRGGIGEVQSFEYQTGRPTFFRVVGLLAGSVLQGKLMVGDANFTRAFPTQTGYRFFLIDVPNADAAEALTTALETRLSDAGIDVQSTDRVLAGMLAVQNTYLRTFQSLGALGLLLGTIGLAVAQLRGALQRRGELAVLRAIGFTRWRLAGLMLRENAFLLLMGVGCGVLTALLAVMPALSQRTGQVPVAEPLVILAAILLFGFLAGMIAVIRVATLPLIESLRAEDAAVEI